MPPVHERNAKMNICLLNDSFPPVIDGVANTVMNYARVITAEGHEAIVATPRYPDADYSGYPYRVVPYQSFNISNLVQGYRAGNPLAMGEKGTKPILCSMQYGMILASESRSTME